MEIIPLMGKILIYLLGLLVLIIIITYITKMFRKNKDEDEAAETSANPIGNNNAQTEQSNIFEKPKEIETPTAHKDTTLKVHKEVKKESKLFTEQNIVPRADDNKADFFIKDKDAENTKPRKRPKKSTDNSNPRFQILNDDLKPKNQ